MGIHAYLKKEEAELVLVQVKLKRSKRPFQWLIKHSKLLCFILLNIFSLTILHNTTQKLNLI